MNNKIVADHWFIMCSPDSTLPFCVSISYNLGDERNKKSHRFATYAEAYKWLENQVVL